MFLRSQKPSEIQDLGNIGSGLPFSDRQNSTDGNSSSGQSANLGEASGSGDGSNVAENFTRINHEGKRGDERLFKMEEISALLPDFSGSTQENVNHFINIVQHTKQVFKISEEIMKLLVFKCLKGNAQVWFTSSPELMSMEFEDFLASLKMTFVLHESLFQVRKRLESRKWRENETFGQYCCEKRILAVPLRLRESEFVEYLVEGIPDQQLKNQARMQNFSTVADVSRAFSMIKLRGPSTSTSLVCYNCKLPGHIAARCRKIRQPFEQKDQSTRRNNPWMRETRIGAVDATSESQAEQDYNGLD
ncbi:uncharacterized protein LOC134287772 [Aedes albopictus]|uniref:CCHC-type domain-containing protein n=1 Tax=Aedes albopictus TaxID=7160 RepID=A0ABM1ZV65_AEDAL